MNNLTIIELKKKFKTLLKEDLKATIEEIENSITNQSRHRDVLLMYENQLNTKDKDYKLNLIKFEEFDSSRSKILSGVLNLINELKEEDISHEHLLSFNLNDAKKKSHLTKDADNLQIINDSYNLTKNDKLKISIAPTVFFSNRMTKAFPGVRGLKWFEGEIAIKRLSILLKEPTIFDFAEGHGLYSDPIWWRRGFSGRPVERFKIYPKCKCLLNYQELKITKIAAYVSPSYYRCFVYVETEAEQPIGLYEYSYEKVSEYIESFGYHSEEYVIFEDVPIKVEELCDGWAEINGEIIDIYGAEPRTRYLTKYNFLIAAKSSPYNTDLGQLLGEDYMNAILHNNKSLEEFANSAETLTRNRIDD